MSGIVRTPGERAYMLPDHRALSSDDESEDESIGSTSSSSSHQSIRSGRGEARRGAAAAARVAGAAAARFPRPINRLPEEPYIDAGQQVLRRDGRSVSARIDLHPAGPAQNVRIDLRPVGQREVITVQRELITVIRGSSGAARELEPSERTAERTQDLFYQTKEQIFDHLVEQGRDLGERDINQILISINYTRREAIITDEQTGDRITTLDLTNLPEGVAKTEIERLIKETLKANKEYVSVKEHELREYHTLNHGPLKGVPLFRINPGVGATMEDFIKKDMRAIMNHGARGIMESNEQHYVAAAKRIATIDVYHHQLQEALKRLINEENRYLQTQIEERASDRDIQQREADIRLLNARLNELRSVSKEALYYLATQQDYIDSPDGGDRLFKAHEIADDMTRYLLDIKHVNVHRRLMEPTSWLSGKKDPSEEYERFAVGVGALSIETTDRAMFNDYAKRNKLSVDATIGIGHTLLYTSVRAHERGGVPTEVLGFLLDGIQDDDLRGSIQVQFNETQANVEQLHEDITTVEEAITRTKAQTA